MAIVKLNVAQSPSIVTTENDIASIDDLRDFAKRNGIDGVPVDLLRLASGLGIEVRQEQMDDDMSGYLERRGARWVIGVNQYHHPVRQRFTIAHELAHFALHRNRQSRFDDVTFTRRHESPTTMEREADRFAADLLMPREAVNSVIGRGVRNLNSLASAFSVSTIAMNYRLRDLGYQLT